MLSGLDVGRAGFLLFAQKVPRNVDVRQLAAETLWRSKRNLGTTSPLKLPPTGVIKVHRHHSTALRHTTQDAGTTLSPCTASDASTAAEANGLPGCSCGAIQHKANSPPVTEATGDEEDMVRSSSSTREEYGTCIQLKAMRSWQPTKALVRRGGLISVSPNRLRSRLQCPNSSHSTS